MGDAPFKEVLPVQPGCDRGRAGRMAGTILLRHGETRLGGTREVLVAPATFEAVAPLLPGKLT